ncbi:MAG: hypothetical protein H6867_06020 [Rhodospirillales bacterium]|nr:hypothetical protein [Rhodospirillales bacterium]MCB9995085.1 hypothetical protein [Rhodospirillales bacterium]
MPEEGWEYQVRVNLSEEFQAALKRREAHPARTLLSDVFREYFVMKKRPERLFEEVLEKYDARIKNQFEAFADFCRDAEANGETDSTLYRWTKDTIEKPGKAEQYADRFTIYAEGGKEVYSKETADGLERDLQPLLDSGLITKISKIDSNPAHNPQAPKKFDR